MRSFFFQVLILATASVASAQGAVPRSGPFGVEAFTGIYSLPILRSGVQTREFTSYDRAGDNYDADYFPIYEDRSGELVLFDSYGPGCLYRLHMNIWNGDLTGIRIRFYFDGEPKPRIDMDVTQFFSDKNPLGIFRQPFAHVGEGYRLVYHPFFYVRRLKVALNREPLGHAPGWDKLPWLGRYDKHPYRRNHWYEFTYCTYSENPGFESWTHPVDMSAVAALWNPARIGMPPIGEPPGTVISNDLRNGPELRLRGPGTITELHFKIDPTSASAIFDTWITITFDGARSPQVNAPLGCFFGCYRTDPSEKIRSLFAGCSKDDLYCFFPMPFWKSAVIRLIGGKGPLGAKSISIRLAASKNLYPKSRCGWFYALYNRKAPRTEGHDYRYADFRGHGQLVGHFAYRWNTSMEEDERTYFDDNLTPQITGEGYEDDHNQGWGLRDLDLAAWGCVAADGGSGAPWRFYMPDLYVFQDSVRSGHQTYGPHSPRGHEGMYQVGTEESVAFLYAKPELNLEKTDELDIGNSASRARHALKHSGKADSVHGSWWYDGEFNNVLFPLPPVSDDGVSSSGASTFTMRIDPHNQGVRLRRRTDKDINRQLADVYVDGKLVTEHPWYSVDFERTFRNIRWFDSDFEIPPRYTRGKRIVRIRIKPISPLWSEFHYWAYCYRS